MLASGAFNRHTFMCGQSGSGKSYAMGVLIEQIMIDTDVPMLILDPNGDFVGLHSVVESAETGERTRLEASDVPGVSRPGAGGTAPAAGPLHGIEHGGQGGRAPARPVDRPGGVQRAAPDDDAFGTRPPKRCSTTCCGPRTARSASSPTASRTSASSSGTCGRVRTSRARSTRGAAADRRRRPRRLRASSRAAGRHSRDPRCAVGARELRKPVLLVIDEAHNVCPTDPTDPLARATTDGSSRSPTRVASTASGCCCARSDRRASTSRFSCSATTWR